MYYYLLFISYYYLLLLDIIISVITYYLIIHYYYFTVILSLLSLLLYCYSTVDIFFYYSTRDTVTKLFARLLLCLVYVTADIATESREVPTTRVRFRPRYKSLARLLSIYIYKYIYIPIYPFIYVYIYIFLVRHARVSYVSNYLQQNVFRRTLDIVDRSDLVSPGIGSDRHHTCNRCLEYSHASASLSSEIHTIPSISPRKTDLRARLPFSQIVGGSLSLA